MTTPIDLEAAARELCVLKGLKFHHLLGRGAFKSAFLVEDSGYLTALKLSSEQPERLQREAEALRTCCHAAIVAIQEFNNFSFQGHTLWVVREEYIAGGTLEGQFAARSLDPSEVRVIGQVLIGALEHLRERNLVHRDIKPANILFRQGLDTPVLTDFGIVRMLDEKSLTQDFWMQGPGTPKYSAPEQLTNQKALIDWRTDQFGLAVVLAECLLKRHPFQEGAATVRDAVLRVAARQDLPQAARDNLASLGFKSLIRALAPWPVSRYRTPDEFLKAITL